MSMYRDHNSLAWSVCQQVDSRCSRYASFATLSEQTGISLGYCRWWQASPSASDRHKTITLVSFWITRSTVKTRIWQSASFRFTLVKNSKLGDKMCLWSLNNSVLLGNNSIFVVVLQRKPLTITALLLLYNSANRRHLFTRAGTTFL